VSDSRIVSPQPESTLFKGGYSPRDDPALSRISDAHLRGAAVVSAGGSSGGARADAVPTEAPATTLITDGGTMHCCQVTLQLVTGLWV
jgi:hypothetical protein